jgi:hypothetical protein
VNSRVIFLPRNKSGDDLLLGADPLSGRPFRKDQSDGLTTVSSSAEYELKHGGGAGPEPASETMVYSNIESIGSPTGTQTLANVRPAVEHNWLADEWPEHLQFRTALGIPMDGEEVLNHQVVPRTDQGLLSWAYVGTNPSATDRSRTLRLLYRNPPVYKNRPLHVIFPVGVRIQGFVDSCNLRALGNWKRFGLPR